jgi:hypothetical protein
MSRLSMPPWLVGMLLGILIGAGGVWLSMREPSPSTLMLSRPRVITITSPGSAEAGGFSPTDAGPSYRGAQPREFNGGRVWIIPLAFAK